MLLSSFFIASAFAWLAAAQSANHFTMATIPASIPAGSTFDITWAPSTPGTISLLLVEADGPGSTIVHPVSTIAANITNSGSFSWLIPSTTVKGSYYALEIVSDSDPTAINYSGQFAIDSTTVSSSVVSSAASTASTVSSGLTTVTSTVSSTGSSSPSSTTASSDSASTSGTTTSGSSTSATKGSSTTTSASAASASSTAMNAAAQETARAKGVGLLAFVGAAMLVL